MGLSTMSVLGLLSSLFAIFITKRMVTTSAPNIWRTPWMVGSLVALQHQTPSWFKIPATNSITNQTFTKSIHTGFRVQCILLWRYDRGLFCSLVLYHNPPFDGKYPAGTWFKHVDPNRAIISGHFWMTRKRPAWQMRWPSGPNSNENRPHFGSFLHIRPYSNT